MKDKKKKLTRQQKEYFTNLFHQFDEDSSGSISSNQLLKVLKACKLNVDQQEVEDMINEVDADGSGEIEIDQFLALLEKQINDQAWTNEQFYMSYNLFDFDSQGRISFKQLKKMLQNLGQKVPDQQIKEMISYADKDGDGAVNFVQFTNVMK